MNYNTRVNEYDTLLLNRLELKTLKDLDLKITEDNPYRFVNVSENELTSLEGLPEGIIGVYCYDNYLTSLEGLPKGVKYINCHTNYLTSLEGLPEGVLKVYCNNNKLTSLKGLPDSVDSLNCSDNPYLTSLEGLPERTIIYCENTPVYIQALLQGRMDEMDELDKGLVEIIKYIQ